MSEFGWGLLLGAGLGLILIGISAMARGRAVRRAFQDGKNSVIVSATERGGRR